MTELDPEPRPKKAMWRRLLRLCTWIFVLLALLILLAPLALRGRVRDELLSQLAKRFDADVSVSEFDLGWLSGITLERLVVKPKGGGEPWIQVAHARFAPSILPFFRGELRWQGTVLEDVVIRGERDSSGWIAPRWSSDESAEEGPFATRSTIEFEGELPKLNLDLRIEGLRFEVSDARWPEAMVLNFDQPIRVFSPTARRLRFDTRYGSGLDLALECELKPEAAHPSSYAAHAELSLVANQAPLEDLRSMVAPWCADLSGRAHGELRYTLTPKTLSGGGTLQVQDVVAASHTRGVLPLPEEAQLRSKLSGSPQSLSHLAALVAPGWNGEWSLQFEDFQFATSRLSAELEPEAVEAWLPAQGGLGLEGGALSLNATVEATSARSYDFDAQLDTAKTIFYLGEDGQAMRGPGVLRATGSLFPGTSMRVEAGRFEAPGIDAQWSADPLKISMQADLALDELTRAWLEKLGVGVLAQGRGALSVALTRAAEDTRFEGDVHLNADRISTLGLDVRKLAMHVVAERDGRFALRELQSALNGGELRCSGMLTPDQRFELAVQANGVKMLEGAEFQVARIMPLLAGAGTAWDALLDVQLDLHGGGAETEELLRSIHGSGRLGWSTGVLRQSSTLSQPLAILGLMPTLRLAPQQAQFEIKAGDVYLPPIELNVTGFRLALSGTTKLDGSLHHELALQFPSNALRALGWVLDEGGRLRLPLRGTVSAPRLELPSPATILQGGLEDGLRRKLGGILDGLKRK